MAVWTVWENAEFDDPAVRAVFVEDRFAWWALLIGPLWAMLRGMPVVALLAVAVWAAVVGAAATFLGSPGAVVFYALLSLWFAFEARALKRWSLSRRRWRMTAIVHASARAEAERRYFAERDGAVIDPIGEAAPAPLATPPAPASASGAGPWGAPVIGVMPEKDQ